MVSRKYSVCKTKTGKTKKEIIKGVKKVCYKKQGSSKMYVKSKGRFMSLTKYKKMKSKQSGGSTAPYSHSSVGGKKKSKKTKRGDGARINRILDALKKAGVK